MSKLVSIIIPVFNAAPFLRAMLDSVIIQSYKDWELIAVNDFSSDLSLGILSEYAKMDDRIVVYNNIEKGITPALRLGYSHSTGQYITRMDADDIMTPNKIECLVTALKDKPNAVSTGKVEYFSESKDVKEGYLKYAEWLNSMVSNNNHFENIYKECVIPSPCWMTSRSVFEVIGGFHAFDYPEDYDLVFRMYKHGVEVIPVNKVLHRWRDHNSRASRTDDNYSDQGFINIKIHYFLELEYKKTKPLALWGAGKSAKQLAKQLVSAHISFRWFTDNEKKIGKDIYGVKLESIQDLSVLVENQIIIAIKSKGFNESETVRIERLKESNVLFFFY